MKSKNQGFGRLVPRPVHPTAVRHHGLFGLPHVRQHMVIDNRWTPSSLRDQFMGMTRMLAKRMIFKKLETDSRRMQRIRENRSLKRQCYEGRAKLQMTLDGDNKRKLRNYLVGNLELQRLYENMPLHLVVENIDQRTFVMRKERDRLRYRLQKLSEIYEKKLLERAEIQNRIKFANEFVLEEEKRTRLYHKKIENSNVRLRAIKCINDTYKKMKHILRQDAVFYDPIIKSLDRDIEDQQAFVQHIIFLGLPAIKSYNHLNEEYKKKDEQYRKSLQAKLENMAQHTKETGRTAGTPREPTRPFILPEKRYVRDTPSMKLLRRDLETNEVKIKMLQSATLSSDAKEIYPRVTATYYNNTKLRKAIEKDIQGHQSLETKMKRAQVLEEVSINNLSEEELARLEEIESLKAQISAEKKFQAETAEHIKSKADAYAMLRYTLWSFNDILQHVDRSTKVVRVDYPNSYLQLPLLKFENLTMCAYPPENYEQNIDEIMHSVKRKVHKLMKAHNSDLTEEMIRNYADEFHDLFLDTVDVEELNESGDETKEEEDKLLEAKLELTIPNRVDLKAQSFKIVEDFSHKDD